MWGFLVAAFSVFYVLLIVPGREQIDVISSNGFPDSDESQEDYINGDQNPLETSDHHDNHRQHRHDDGWFEEQLEDDLKHKDLQKVVMCDIDRVVVEFCRAHLTANHEAFCDERLHIAINDAKDELEKSEEKFDVIIGDLADPLEGGPCNELYTKCFYEQVLKPKLNPNGIFVTQAGPAGILSHKQIFTSIYNTIKHVFKNVIAYTAHLPSYADSCGWVLASDEPLKLNVGQLHKGIQERIKDKLHYLDGASIVASTVLNKTLQKSLSEETHVSTEENARFIHGHGLASDKA